MVHEVVSVECLGGYRLRLTFGTGEVGTVDIQDLVPFDGVFAPLKDSDYFRTVAVNQDIGSISWPNGADLCPDVLYSSAFNIPLPSIPQPSPSR